jgi:peptidoglycan/xylan/chitin deacetylase (PgdA/CDA1 family)
MIWRLLSSWSSPAGHRGGLTVLFFHRVLGVPDPLLPDEPQAAEFERLVRWLRGQFRLLPLGEALQRQRDGRLPAGTAAVTFDDGYRDNLDVAAPVLQRHGVPATLFVATDFIDGGLMWNDRVIEAVRASPLAALDLGALGLPAVDLSGPVRKRAAVVALLSALKYRPPAQREADVDAFVRLSRATALPRLMMNAGELRRIAELGFDLGAHTCSHPILAQLPDDEAQRELQGSRERLEGLLGRPVRLFAYPNGRAGRDFDARHARIAAAAGFDAAFTTEPGVCRSDSDRWALPRFTPWDRRPGAFQLQLLRNQWRRAPALEAQHA